MISLLLSSEPKISINLSVSCDLKTSSFFLLQGHDSKVGTQIFLVSTQIANPKILGLISLSQIRKFLRRASTHISYVFSPQIVNPQ